MKARTNEDDAGGDGDGGQAAMDDQLLDEIQKLKDENGTLRAQLRGTPRAGPAGHEDDVKQRIQMESTMVKE